MERSWKVTKRKVELERSWQVTNNMEEWKGPGRLQTGWGDGKVLEDYKQHRGTERSCKVTNRKVGLERSWKVTNSMGEWEGPQRLQTG